MGWFSKSNNSTAKAEEKIVEKRLIFSKKLQALTNRIHSTNNLDEIMLELSADICDLFNCDRLTLYAVSKDRDFIFSKVKTGINTNHDLVLPLNSDSIAGYVALFKRSICISDVYDEAELKACAPELKFNREVDQVTGYHTKQMLAAPLVSPVTREALGVIQLINDRTDIAFSEMAEVGLEDLCETLTIAFTQRMKPVALASSKYDALIVDGTISRPELELAATAARRKSIDIEDVLVDEFQVKLEMIGHALAKNFGVPYERFKLDRIKPSEVLQKLNRASIEQNRWLPIELDKSSMVIMTTDPEHVNRDRSVNKAFPYFSFYFRVTTQREFKQTIDQFFGG